MFKLLKPKNFYGLALSALLCAFVPIQSAQAAATLDDISFASLPGERLQLRIELSERVDEPLVFAVDNPARIAMDFPGVGLKVKKRSQAIGVGLARSVAAVATAGRTRVVLNLLSMVPYRVERDGNAILLTLASEGGETPQVSGSSVGPSSTSQPAQGTGKQLKNVDFRRGKGGEGRVLVTLSHPSIVIDTRTEGNKIIVEYKDTALPSRLERKLNVIDFATPVASVDTFTEGNSVRMEIEAATEFEQVAYQSDNLFTIDLRPRSKEEQDAERKRKFGYTGERLSLNFQNIEVRAVLQLIADFTGLNLVASDTVAGNLTLRLKNVPWDQALDIILKSKGLAMRQAGNVVMVAPSEEIAARERLELEAQKQITELAPLETEFMQVNYAKAVTIAELMKAEENSLLTDRGNVTVDERTNTLLVRDTRNALESIRALVDRLDIPIRQVLIEARIVVADTTFREDLGVRLGVSRRDTLDNENHFFTLGGRNAGDVDFAGTTSFNTDGQENYIVSLPVAGATTALGFAIGKIGSSLLNLELTALSLEGRGEVLANPRVITSNQKEALIEQGTQIPYQEASSSGATTTSFIDAVLSLRVTPQITPDDRIIMDLTVNQDTVGQLFNNIPSIDTRAVDTQVLVDNGETVVLGGIYQQTQRTDISKTPFFGDLPYLGRLFRQDSEQDTRSELLIFITPRILKDSLKL